METKASKGKEIGILGPDHPSRFFRLRARSEECGSSVAIATPSTCLI
jgi:hypothetical protein